MKKKILGILLVLASMIGTALIFSNKNQKVDADGYKYFNPTIPYPQDPCVSAGGSVCYS
ncbi:hypothetical protein [Maribellus maritimus]|uniref:hypothetical protein n=1 Tax=Maribellus maritimus TaxID=2870838 RepID=UPI001EEAC3AF|nr:hypothetical protein [Maribellus maritimus]MCG6188129.1 hypothetical protein [Maribellus maritimus]